MILCFYVPGLLTLTHWPNLTPPPPELQGLQLDKLVHFAMYVLVAFLCIQSRLVGRAAQPTTNLILGATLAALLGVVDEYTQKYVPGRHASVLDGVTNLTAVGSVAVAQAMSWSRFKGRTVAAWVCRIALCLLFPYLTVLTLGPRLNLENILLQIAPALGVQLQADKLAHLIGAAVITWLIYGAQLMGVGRRIANLFFTMIVVAALGPLVEMVQLRVGRGYELADIAAHSFGLGIGLLVIIITWLILLIAKPKSTQHDRWHEPSVDTPHHSPTTATTSDSADTVNNNSINNNDVATSTRAHTASTSVVKTNVPTSTKPKTSFVAAAKVVGLLTLLSRLTGLARDVYLAGALGLSGIADAFWFGFQVPNLFRRLFGEGALTAAFIPVYTHARQRDAILARRFASLCFAVTLIVLGSLTLIGELALAGILWQRELTSDWSLAIQLTMVMLPYMPMVCLVALCGAVLQVHGRFAPAAGMPIFLNLVMIVGTYLALRGITPGNDSALRTAIFIIAGSVVIAGVIQLTSQLALMLRHEQLTLVFRGAGPLFTQFRTTFIPSFLALAVFQINTFMDAMLAMGLSPKHSSLTATTDITTTQLNLFGYFVDHPIAQGGLAALNNAQRLYQFPLGVFGVAIATAIFPALAQAAAAPGLAGAQQFRNILQQGLRLTVFIGLPASVGLIVTSLPLARVLFERGAFTLDDSQRVAWVLIGYAPAIWAYSMSQVLTRAFYAVRDARTPMVLSLAMVVLNFLLNITLVWVLGAAGLAWATAICAITQCALMLMLVRGCVDQPMDRSVWTGWGKTLGLSLIMALVIAPILIAYPPLSLSKTQVLLQLSVMVTLGAAVYLGGAYILKCPELGWIGSRRKR